MLEIHHSGREALIYWHRTNHWLVTSPSADLITPGIWEGSRWVAKFQVTDMSWLRKRSMPKAGIKPRSVALKADAVACRLMRWSDTYGLISFRLGMMIETTELYILIPVLMTLTFTWGNSCKGYHGFMCSFSLKFGFGWNSVSSHNLLVCGTHSKFILHK